MDLLLAMSAWQNQHNQHYPQPWQSPQTNRSSWQDPRFSNQNSYTADLPVVQNPPDPVHAYNVPNALDTSNWGVKFHQAQQPEYPTGSKPPLPPRPASGLAHTASPAPITNSTAWQAPSWQNPVPQTQIGYTQALGYGTGHQWPLETFENQPSHLPSHHQPPPQSPLPPAPPPRPSADQSQAQLNEFQWSNLQSSNYAPSPNYDPRSHAQPYKNQQSSQVPQLPPEPGRNPNQAPMLDGAQTTQVDQPPPVSPEATHVMSWVSPSEAQISSQHSKFQEGSSALGVSGPSDWEQFQASVEDIEDGRTATINARRQWEDSAPSDGCAELSANFSRTASRQGYPRHDPAQHIEPTCSQPATSKVLVCDQSVSLEPSVECLRRTGTIDGVIQAWSTPLQSSIVHEDSRKSSVSTLDRSRRDALDSIKSSSEQALQNSQPYRDQTYAVEHDIRRQADQEQEAIPNGASARQYLVPAPPLLAKTIEVDPYVDLGPEYKASLARYAIMLRKEEAAPEEEKYRIFVAFVQKETRLRSILYGLESEDTEIGTLPQRQAKKTEHEDVGAHASTTSAPNVSRSLPIQPTLDSPKSALELSPKLTIETPPATKDDSYVVVERDDQLEYSPGGRPRPSRNTPQKTASHPEPKPSPKATTSPSDYAPILFDELARSLGDPVPASPHAQLQPETAPLAMMHGATTNTIRFEPPRPAYTPFRYAEGPQKVAEPLARARPAYEAYSALRHQSMDSGRVMARSAAQVTSPMRPEMLASPSANNVRHEHEEAFLGLIREKSHAYRKGKQGKAPGAPVNDLAPLPDSVDRQTQAVHSLREIIPKTMPQQWRPSTQIVGAKHAMDKYPDVFTWIPEIVVLWDRENKAVRKKQEEERQARQEQSEKNIDALFNDHEIGYSDIGQLESDFKLAEATKKYEEDVQELDSFIDQVFRPVTERLKEELYQLSAQYIRAVDVLELEADSGSQYIQGDGDRASRSAAMEVVLALYNKLQIRHVKTAEAHYERERRRKKLELSVLYTNGDTAAMKKLEQEFSRAERQQALHEAREKDSRANKLMDTFDRAIVRGLGENQQLIDEIVTRLQRINDLLREKSENATELLLAGLHATLRSLEELLDYVASDSKSLLTMSNTVEDMLNNADYDVSVAEARAANATQESMTTLEDEKNKEDERIKAEVDTRMGSVAKGPEKALSLVRSIMKRTGDDPQHQDRVQKALEAAKIRNAKTPVGVGTDL